MVLSGNLLLAACGGAYPATTIDVIPPVSSDHNQAIAEMQAEAERIAHSLGFEPSPDKSSIGLIHSQGGNTRRVLSMFRLGGNPQVRVNIVEHNFTMLGITVWDIGTNGVEFEDQSTSKLKLQQLVSALRKEFGSDRVIVDEWTQKQMQ